MLDLALFIIVSLHHVALRLHAMFLAPVKGAVRHMPANCLVKDGPGASKARRLPTLRW